MSKHNECNDMKFKSLSMTYLRWSSEWGFLGLRKPPRKLRGLNILNRFKSGPGSRPELRYDHSIDSLQTSLSQLKRIHVGKNFFNTYARGHFFNTIFSLLTLCSRSVSSSSVKSCYDVISVAQLVGRIARISDYSRGREV